MKFDIQILDSVSSPLELALSVDLAKSFRQKSWSSRWSNADLESPFQIHKIPKFSIFSNSNHFKQFELCVDSFGTAKMAL